MQVKRWSSPYFHTFSMLFYAIDKIIDKLEKTFKSSQRTVLIICTVKIYNS